MKHFWYYTKEAIKDACLSYWEPIRKHPILFFLAVAILACLAIVYLG